MLSKSYSQMIQTKGNFLWLIIASLLIIFAGLAAAPKAQAEILFEDHFNDASSLSKYTIIRGHAWIEDQQLHTQGYSGDWPRGSMVIPNGDPQWTNFKMSVEVQPIAGWQETRLYFPSESFNFDPSGYGFIGKGYVLSLDKETGIGPFELAPGEVAQFDTIILARVDCPAGGCGQNIVSTASFSPLNTPVDVNVIDNGKGHFQVFLNGTQYMDYTDPSPLAAGGIGLGGVWETHATFDNLVVQSIPEPETYAMLLAGLGLLGFMARRRKESTA
ncbi:PEP-CTERM sorting domain-containing protein [Nitrosomonas sp.]|uniref:PEP-CTERM sorting domain-containing protein n=1 Tax=Nitrosomonas sp. TaxID=42353 RepID=UPI0032EF94C9